MKRHLEPSGSIAALKHSLDSLVNEGAKGVMLLSCDANGYTPDTLNPLLLDMPVPVFGGIFPQILYGDQRLEKGSVLLGLFTDTPYVQIIENISDPATNISDIVAGIDEISFSTMFVYVDAFATAIDKLIDELYFEFGLSNNFIGGGAGSLSFEQKPVVITPQGLLQDAAVLARTAARSTVGVSHGWQRISGPFQITKAQGNTIEELDFAPAFNTYRKVVEQHSGLVFDEGNFFDIAKAFPFGINKLGSENVVRDPISVDEEGALICVGSVSEGEFVDILHGDNHSLISAAQKAGEAVTSSTTGKGIVLIDCISRVLFLEDAFQQELDAVAGLGEELVGALTLGEIANSGQDYLEFYNKTIVVAAF